MANQEKDSSFMHNEENSSLIRPKNENGDLTRSDWENDSPVSSKALDEYSNSENTEVFLKPTSFIIPIRKKKVGLQVGLSEGLTTVDSISSEEETAQDVVSTVEKPQPVCDKPKLEKSPSQRVAEKEIPVPYKEPPWSGLPPNQYSFEVIKNGVQIDNILFNKPFLVVGKLSQCDIVLEHPSVSRFHSVIQYRAEETKDNPPGLYVYDLDSTHGTFQNKYRLLPRKFNHLRVGHILKFGGSTRMFILQGPNEDQEPEMEESVSELVALANERKKKAEVSKSKEEERAECTDSDQPSEGIDWGMGDDAAEEDRGEDPDWMQNPYAMSEDLYLNDPKKTLRGWFQREGHDLPDYRLEEIKPGHFRATVELPVPGGGVEGKPFVCVVEHKGKKKDAVVHCSLEACRVLDRQGLLRQATHESHERKRKDWSENDYYDSDEDEFLDRTGDIERKRQKRKHDALHANKEKIETYDSLTRQYSEITAALEKVESELQLSDDLKKQKNEAVSDASEADELESFMAQLSSQFPDKHKITAWKIEMIRLRKEEAKVRKLINLVRPLGVQELRERIPKYTDAKNDATKTALSHATKPRKHEKASVIPRIHSAFLEDDEDPRPKLRKVNCDDDDDDDKGSVRPVPYSRPQQTLDRYRLLSNRVQGRHAGPLDKPLFPESLRQIGAKEPQQLPRATQAGSVPEAPLPICPLRSGDSRPPPILGSEVSPGGAGPQPTAEGVESEGAEAKEEEEEQESPSGVPDRDPPGKRAKGPSLPPPEVQTTFAKPSPPTAPARSKPKAAKKPQKNSSSSSSSNSPFAFDDQYETWVPPKGQTGDGRTALNDKLGY